ncbi:Gfo/Idh/MocA family protein [Puia sp. P3]|uniref:Gfo/Idh/MocA family protein n=1 Tax=Puia sp. P3 TaxID=3423952 RepID=UPI003D66B9AB
MKQFTWGIIGPGKIANKFAIALTLVEGTSLGAVASRDIARAKSFAEAHNVPTIYDSYDQLAADPSIDAVYIATPHGYHAEHASLCLRHGKAVLCEKPMALSARQVGEMVDTARANNAFLMEAMWTRFLPLTEEITRQIADGQIGDLAISAPTSASPPPSTPPDASTTSASAAAPSSISASIPSSSVSIFSANPGRSPLPATSRQPAPTTPATPSSSLPKASSAVITSTLTCQTGLTAEIAGAHAAIHILSPWYRNDRFTIHKNNRDQAAGEPILIQLEPMINGFEYQIRETMNCVSTHLIESPKMSFDFSLLMARTMDTIRTQLGVKYPTE